jgi:TonB family protein
MNYSFMKKVIFSFIFIAFPGLCYGQELPKSGCIQIYSDPDRVKIEIPELKLKALKDSFLYEINGLHPGNYTVTIKNKLNTLKVTILMILTDTFLVYANFKESSIIAVTKSDFKAYNEEQLKKNILTDSLITDTLNTYFVVEDMPMFHGGDPAIEFRKFIAENMRYPPEAAEKGIAGRVIVQFVIDENGKLIDPAVVHSAHPLLDREALRVIRLSPSWKPGKQKGKNVKVFYAFPISFYIN